LGRRGEDIAHRWVQREGMRVVGRNWLAPVGHGEADIIAEDGDKIVFIEVKTRQSSEYADPERNVDRIKLIALRRAALAWLKMHDRPESDGRLDLASIVMEPELEFRYVRDAWPL
jgi:putative endonuclease